MNRILQTLLEQRGLDESFLRSKYEDLFDPFLMPGVAQAVDRIELARDGGEKIVIYGDYDEDGVTASTVLFAALEQFGCRGVEIILPDRFKDGYGMNMPAVDKIEACGAKLVVTVDCGSGSGEVIDALAERGIDCIVTDHHEIPNVPRGAIAVVNPRLAGEKYGLRMAGVGVAFTLARALNARAHGGVCDGQEKWLLDMVAIGTICDSMSLLDENRIMVYYGMKVISKMRRLGLRELAKAGGVDLENIDTHAIGFQIGPRLNAAGRMKSANLALDLMCANERAKAYALAEELNALNAERKKAQEEAIKEVGEQIDESASVIVARGKWHEGIIGIIAGRLVEIYKKPAFALTELPDGRLKGSGRSFGDFSLAEALQNCEEGLLLSGGGHAGACGMSIRAEDFERFCKSVNDYYESLGLVDQEKYLRHDSDIVLRDFSDITPDSYDEIMLLEPFGEGNPEPIFEVELDFKNRRVLKEKHLSLLFFDANGKSMKMMAFYAPEEWLSLPESGRARVQFTLMKNEWRGNVEIAGNIISLEEIPEIC